MANLSAEESRELAQSVRAACTRLCPEERLRAVAFKETGRYRGFAAPLWQALCAQVGVLAIALPEELGGAGYGTSALGVVAHELGRALAPVPFVPSVLATGLIVNSNPGLAAEQLAALAAGECTAAAAICGDGGGWHRNAVTLTARQRDATWAIDGEVRHVLGGAAADVLLVVGNVDGQPEIFLLDATSDGVAVRLERVLDGTRPMATIGFSSAPAVRLSDGPADAVIECCLQRTLAVLSAEQVGACERLLEIATDYARTRQQFGRPIGSFQAIKHRCADMLVDLEFARSAAQAALQSADDGELSWRASMAKAVCSEALRSAAHANLQIHGGIGYTWEDSAHLYVKRARTDEVLFGAPGHHWDRLAIEAKLA
ncbi:acyl-CoA dehydrogenase family protein [Mycobacterium sp. UM_CSW]|uniref:acyl-CoA dehydrogenase family protein n=1 Tax=Mycobacterium sp. UM_CSW TaxID=1370119 RepID=UPI001EF9FE5B|nr:acyl-CoA dehydrogenase family protein [Mycobacterium sp. UM_CSW]